MKLDIVNTAKNHMIELTTIGAIVGTISTGVLSYQAGKEIEEIEDPEPMDYVKALSKPLISGLATIGCIGGINYSHTKKYAALLAAFSAGQIDTKKYKEKVREIIGEKEEKKVQNDIYSEDNMERKILDKVTGRIFKKSPMDVISAAQQTNLLILRESTATINDFYDFLNLDPSELQGNNGWRIDGGEDALEIEWGSEVIGSMEPVLTIEYRFNKVYSW